MLKKYQDKIVEFVVNKISPPVMQIVVGIVFMSIVGALIALACVAVRKYETPQSKGHITDKLTTPLDCKSVVSIAVDTYSSRVYFYVTYKTSTEELKVAKEDEDGRILKIYSIDKETVLDSDKLILKEKE